uniref:zinc ribbon domain-containing protein n=1 Tax=Terrisporobacter sp. TaxID=1965305 RepID=UPI00261044D9
MICSKCRQSNSSYNNYCSNDGENLDSMPRKSTLQKSQNRYCLECGCEVRENSNYCMNCGEMIDAVSQKSESFANSKINDFGTRFDSPKGFEFKLPKINLSNFSNVDKKGIVQSTILTLILSSIVIAIINTLLYQDLGIANQMQFGDTGISKFKLFMSSLAAMNVPNVKIVLKASFVSIFNISFVARTIIYPLIVGLFMYISSRIALKKENLEGKVLENSISCAILYSIIMVIVGFIGNYNLDIEEGAYIIISMNSFTLFINSFIISFIGTYLGISRGENDIIVVRFFKKSLINILIGIGIIAIIVGVLVAVELDKNTYLSEVMRYYSFSSKMMLTIVSIVGLIILSCWLFTISNFVGIS